MQKGQQDKERQAKRQQEIGKMKRFILPRKEYVDKLAILPLPFIIRHGDHPFQYQDIERRAGAITRGSTG